MRDLAGKIGISQAMLFAYRTGKSEPTLKALRKLDAAERAGGITPSPSNADETVVVRDGNPKESAGGADEPAQQSDLVAALNAVAAGLVRIAEAIEGGGRSKEG